MNPGKSTKLIEHDDEQNLIFSRLQFEAQQITGEEIDNLKGGVVKP